MENSIVAYFFVVSPKILFFFVFVRVMMLVECLVLHGGVPHCSPRVGLSLLPLVSGTLSAAEFSIASERGKKKKNGVFCFLLLVLAPTHPQRAGPSHKQLHCTRKGRKVFLFTFKKFFWSYP